jgi:hypothetical protein
MISGDARDLARKARRCGGKVGRAAISPDFLALARHALGRVRAAISAHPAVATGLLWAAVLVVRLYAGGFVGLADNFDGHRLTCQVGVAPYPIPADQPLWAYVTPRYDSYTWYGEACSAGGSGQPYLTTAVIPLWIAKLLTATLGHYAYGLPGALDLRMVGLVYIAMAALAIAWCVHELPGRAWVRALIASGIGLAVADSAFAPDFISPLSDPAGIVGLLFLVPALLRLLRVDRVTWREVAAVLAVTVWTIGAKTQLSTILLAVVPCLLARPTALPRRLRLLTRFRVVGALFGRVPAVLVCAALAVFTMGFQQTQSRWLNEIVTYDATFLNLLGHSHHVQGDLRALHLNPGLASAAGSNVVGPGSAAGTKLYPDFLANVTLKDTTEFYATHPWRLVGLGGRGLEGVSAARPSYLGNYPVSAGRPAYAQDCRICVVEVAFTLAEPLRWIVYPLLWGGSILAGLLLAIRGRRSAAARSAGGTLAAVGVSTLAQFWIVMLTDGDSDLQKHMVFTDFGTCLLGPLLIAALIGLDLATEKRVPAAVALPGQPDPVDVPAAVEAVR